MKPPRLSLAICNKPSTTPVPAVVRIRKTSITIRITSVFQIIHRMILKKKKPVNNRNSLDGDATVIGSIVLTNHQNDSFSTRYHLVS